MCVFLRIQVAQVRDPEMTYVQVDLALFIILDKARASELGEICRKGCRCCERGGYDILTHTRCKRRKGVFPKERDLKHVVNKKKYIGGSIING